MATDAASKATTGGHFTLTSGGRSEFDSAFIDHYRELLAYARRTLGDERLSEDAVQETFIKAWRFRGRFNPALGSMRTWLFAIERRVVIDLGMARAKRRTEMHAYDEPRAKDGVEHAMVAWEVEEAIRRLRPEHRHLIGEIYYKGVPSRQVAQELGVPDGTVRSRLFYALKSLRLVLDEMGWEE
jgi:RNA polymerase sigma-70 factor, ECF subfamily